MGRYVADFYCPEAHLVIDLDGTAHNEEAQKEYDASRQQGVTVLRLENDQEMRDSESVLAEVVKALSTSS